MYIFGYLLLDIGTTINERDYDNAHVYQVGTGYDNEQCSHSRMDTFVVFTNILFIHISDDTEISILIFFRYIIFSNWGGTCPQCPPP